MASSSSSSSSSRSSSSSSSQSLSHNTVIEWYDSSDTYELTSLLQVAVEGNMTSPEQEIHMWANKGDLGGGWLGSIKITVANMDESYAGGSNEIGQECVDEKWIEVRSDGVVDPSGQGIVDDAEGGWKPIGGGFTGDDFQSFGDMFTDTARKIFIRFNIPAAPETEGVIYPKLIVQYNLESSSSSSSRSSSSSSSRSSSSSSSRSSSSSSSRSSSSSSSRSSSSSSSRSSSSSSSSSRSSSSSSWSSSSRSSSSSSRSSSLSSSSSRSSSSSSRSSSSSSSSSKSSSSSSRSSSSRSSSSSSRSSSSSSISTATPWTFNPSDKAANITLSNGDLTATSTAGGWLGVRGNMPFPGSGKHYFEFPAVTVGVAASIILGIAAIGDSLDYPGSGALGYGYFSNGNKYNNASGVGYGDTFTDGDIIGVAFDEDNGKIWWSKNNVWQDSGDPAAGTGEAYSGISGTKYPMAGMVTNGDEVDVIFVSGNLNYSPPSGFSAVS